VQANTERSNRLSGSIMNHRIFDRVKNMDYEDFPMCEGYG
jgi:hypothetical protein